MPIGRTKNRDKSKPFYIVRTLIEKGQITENTNILKELKDKLSNTIVTPKTITRREKEKNLYRNKETKP